MLCVCVCVQCRDVQPNSEKTEKTSRQDAGSTYQLALRAGPHYVSLRCERRACRLLCEPLRYP